MKHLLLSAFLISFGFVSSALADLPTYSADVSVNVTADNAAAARERAMQQANRQAVTAIAANFTTRDGLMVLNKLSDEQLLNFVKETTVLEEKTSNVSYIAKLRITAHDRLLKQYLQEKNVPLVVASSADVMVVPLYRKDIESPVMLWDEENLWRLSWEQKPQVIGSIRFIPLVESNMPSLTADKVLNFDVPTFRQLNDLNAGNDVYVIEAFPNEEDGLTVQVTNAQTQRRDIFNVEGPVSSEIYHRAATETALRIADELKGRSIVTSTEPEIISAIYNFKTLSSWLKIEEKISAVTAVENIQVNAIGNGRIQFQIEYIGGTETLSKALMDQHLALTKSEDHYVLTEI